MDRIQSVFIAMIVYKSIKNQARQIQKHELSLKIKKLNIYKMKQLDRVYAFKIVLVGDSGVGKSSICMKYVQSFIFESQRNEGVVKNYNATIKVEDYFVNLGIWYVSHSYFLRDTTCKPQFKELRRLAYADANAFIIVFSVDNKQSFTNAIQKWLHQITKCCPDASIIFVGNKSDLRYSLSQSSEDCVELLPKNTIQQKIRQLKSYKYVECSAMNCEGITDTFIECAKQVLVDESKLTKRKKKQYLLENCNKCQLM